MVLTRRGLALSAAAVMILSSVLVAQKKDDKKQSEVPVSRAQTKRLRELFGL